MKPVLLSQHAKQQLFYRGTTEEEVIDTIQACKWEPAELGRLQCKKDFAYNKSWNSKLYEIKQVRPIFVEEDKEIIVITIYVYYF